MNVFSNNRAGRIVGTSVLLVSAAVLVACGGGGSDDTLSARTPTLQSTNDACGPGTNAGSASTRVVTAKHYCDFNPGSPPATCAAHFPGIDVKEIKVVPAVAGNNTEQITAGPPLVTLAALPAWLGVTLSGTNNNVLAWTATTAFQVVGVVLKNGEQTHVYDYLNPLLNVPGDSNLQPPVLANNILWYNVCYIPATVTPPPTGPAQWCSPGYWKNHTDSWAATGVALSTRYTLSTLDVKTTGRGCSTASRTPSLFEVISMPQCYGGPAANLVADFLSDSHPSINYTGVRVENCPLN